MAVGLNSSCHLSSTYLAGALPCCISAGARLSVRITGGSICPWQEAVTEPAVRVVPVASIALSALCTRELWMTLALASIYVTLEIQGSHCAAITSLRRRDKQKPLTQNHDKYLKMLILMLLCCHAAHTY